MNTKALSSVSWAPSITRTNPTLAKWIKASRFFCANYKTLSDYLITYTDLQNTGPQTNSPSTGRYSGDDIVSLLALMRQELITLLMDMNPPGEGTSATPQIDEQLATHVSRLERLNQRAQTMIEQLTK